MSDFEKAIEFEVNQNLILYKKTFGKEFSLLRSDGVVTGIKCEEEVIFRGNFNGCLNFILGMTKCLELLGKK